ncbi:MAG: hypothetical protein WCP39_05905, partial [Chlamydiota bacterium]
MKTFQFFFVLCLAPYFINATPPYTNEVIIPKTSDTYMEVRHIVIPSTTNQEIGEILAYISQTCYGVQTPILTETNSTR